MLQIINDMIQTAIMLITVIVTWKIYKRKKRDEIKDCAKQLYVEYEKSVEMLSDINKIISEDASIYRTDILFSINDLNYDFWERSGHLLYRQLDESEFKNIDLYFQKLKNILQMLTLIKELTVEEYKEYYTSAAKDDKTPEKSASLMQPREYTAPIVTMTKQMQSLIKIFPKEKLQNLMK